MPKAEHNAKAEPVKERLDPKKRSDDAQDFEEKLKARVVGQDRAVRAVVGVYEKALAGLAEPDRTLGNLLFLGPTGVGKGRLCEATAEALHGDHKAMIKVDCAEYGRGHNVAKLTGSPAGYLGHRETAPILCKDALEKGFSDKSRAKISILMFDEIEKADFEFWQLLLGILDRATLSLGTNEKVDFSNTMIFITSNIGTSEISKELGGAIGFAKGRESADDDLDRRIYHTAKKALDRKFSPEFINRIDKTVVFRQLSEASLMEVLNMELAELQARIMRSEVPFLITTSPEVKELILREGYEPKFGARHLRRALDRLITKPLSGLLASGQIDKGDVILVEIDDGKVVFDRQVPEKALAEAAETAEAAEAAMESE